MTIVTDESGKKFRLIPVEDGNEVDVSQPPVRRRGAKMSTEERRTKTFKHLIQYGVKMMMRRDAGGSVNMDRDSDAYPQHIAAQCDISLEQARAVDNLIRHTLDGCKKRQNHAIEELERRTGVLQRVFDRCIGDPPGMSEQDADDLVTAVSALLGGE